MRVIVCGDRYWHDARAVTRELDALLAKDPYDLEIIEGCAHGADELAGRHEPAWHDHWGRREWFPGGWAWYHPDVQVAHVPADWVNLGRAAGPIRNRSMLARDPDLVLAFHENLDRSKGTADMIRIAREIQVPVRIFTS